MIRNACLAIASLSLALIPSQVLAAWSFKVTNTTSTAVVRLETREVGTGAWRSFSGGLAAGETANFDWAASTDSSHCNDSSGCDWEIRAVYSNGETNSPATFDFCRSTKIDI